MAVLRVYVGLAYREAKAKYRALIERNLIQYITDTLAGNLRVGARFNPPGEFGALYMSLDPETPIDELLRTYARWLDTTRPEDIGAPRLLLTLDVRLSAVADLRDGGECLSWGLTPAALIADDWSPCQDAARYIRRHHEALLAPSATGRGTTLAIFADRLNATSSVTLVAVDDIPPEVIDRKR
jgi:RES domain-containing protein